MCVCATSSNQITSYFLTCKRCVFLGSWVTAINDGAAIDHSDIFFLASSGYTCRLLMTNYLRSDVSSVSLIQNCGKLGIIQEGSLECIIVALRYSTAVKMFILMW